MFGAASQEGWSFEIALGPEEAVRLDGPLLDTQPPVDLLAFAEAMRHSFAAHRRSWEQAKLS
jgi:hypothetical protein